MHEEGAEYIVTKHAKPVARVVPVGASFHSDPADQLIAATARIHGLKLVTADDRIRTSRIVGVV